MAATADQDINRAVNNITSFSVTRSWNNVTDQPKAASDSSSPFDPSASPLGGRLSAIAVPPPAGQQMPRKYLARPQSSGENVAAGFTFGKAKPAVLNMSRQFGQASKAPTAVLVADVSSPEATPNVKTTLNDAQDKMDCSNTKTISIEGPHASPVEGTDTTIVASQHLDHQAQSVESPKLPSESALSSRAISPPFAKVTQTVPDDRTSPPQQDLKVDDSQTDMGIQEPASLNTPALERLPESLAAGPPPCGPSSRSSPSTPKQAQPAIQAQAKVTKSRRRPVPRASNNGTMPKSSGSQSIPSQEDLMNVLVLRYKHDKQVRDRERAAHATEVQDLKDISDLLWQQLQDERTKAQQLGKKVCDYQATVPAWGSKVKKLSDYIRGLTNDHNGLRDKAKEIQQDQDDLRREKMQLDAELEAIHRNLDVTTDWTKNAVTGAKADLRLSLQQSQIQQAQLQDSVAILDSERKRNELYAAEIGKLTTSHDHIAASLADRDSMLMDHLNTLSGKLDNMQNTKTPDCSQELKGIMQECLETLGGLQNGAGINMDELQQLNTSVRGYADSITKSIQAYQQDVQALGLMSQKSASETQQQLLVMSDNVEKQQSLAEQVTEYSVSKAALEEKMRAMEAASAESRQMLAAAQDTEARLHEQITRLETEAISLRNQVESSPAIIERLTEIDCQNQALKDQIKGFQEVSETTSKTLQERLENYADMQLHVEEQESLLKQAQDNALAQAKEQAAAIKEALHKHEEDKKQIRAQAKLESDAMDARHRVEMNEIKHKLTLADERLTEQTQVMEQVRADKQLADQAIAKQVSIIAQSQAGKEAADIKAKKRSEQLQQMIAEKKTAQELAKDKLSQLEKATTNLDHEKSVACSYKESISKLDTQLEERNAKIARLNQSFREAMNDLNGKVGRVSELEEANLQLDIEAREARDARRRADGLLAEEARKVADAIKAFEEYKLANPPRIGTYVDKGNQSANMDSPSKPKRKAHWSALHQDRRSVQDSQSQPAPVPSPARPTTPQGPVVDFFAQFEDDEEPLDDIAALFPPTPDPSSQNLRPTVKFVQDSIQSIESRSYYASQTRNHYASQTTDHFASDHLSSDYITMSQVEETVPRLKQEASQSAGASQKSTATHSPRTILPDSQPSQPRPKSILKASQPAKRTAEDAGLQPAADRPARRRGGLRAESQSLGPVIPESQSQNGSQSQARSRRLSRPAVLKRKDDKFSRRFSQELGE